MTQDVLERNLEFLISFFSVPEKEFYGGIYDGRTPLGVFDTSADRDEFSLEMITAATDLLVNSRNRRPVYPVASEYITDGAERERYLDTLLNEYRLHDRAVIGYPPDHLRVLYEFVLLRIGEGDLDGAAAFHSDFIRGWTTRFTDAIFERKPPEMFRRVALLMDEVGARLGQTAV